MKPIGGDNYTVRPFKTHKTQVYQYTYFGGENPTQLTVDYARVPPSSSAWNWYTDQESINARGTYQRALYASLEHLFYRPEAYWNSGPTLNKGFTLVDDVYVISVAQSAYGEKIHTSTFSIEAPGRSTGSIIDNGLGQLVPMSNTGSIIGNIFYELGIAVVAKDTTPFSSSIVSHNGVFLTTGSILEVTFDATQTIYEHQALCTMEPGEFGFSLNPSMRSTASLDGAFKPIDKFASGTLTPYMTSVGLYTSLGELVAVAKFPNAIKRAVESQQSFVIRFDA